MCLLLQENRSDHLELSYLRNIKSFRTAKLKKTCTKGVFTHNDAVITRSHEVSRPKHFFNHHHQLDTMIVYHHMQNEQKPIK